MLRAVQKLRQKRKRRHTLSDIPESGPSQFILVDQHLKLALLENICQLDSLRNRFESGRLIDRKKEISFGVIFGNVV